MNLPFLPNRKVREIQDEMKALGVNHDSEITALLNIMQVEGADPGLVEALNARTQFLLAPAIKAGGAFSPDPEDRFQGLMIGKAPPWDRNIGLKLPVNALLLGSTGSGKSTLIDTLILRALDENIRVAVVEFEKYEGTRFRKDNFLIVDVTRNVWNPFFTPYLGWRAAEIVNDAFSIRETGGEALETAISTAKKNRASGLVTPREVLEAILDRYNEESRMSRISRSLETLASRTEELIRRANNADLLRGLSAEFFNNHNATYLIHDLPANLRGLFVDFMTGELAAFRERNQILDPFLLIVEDAGSMLAERHGD